MKWFLKVKQFKICLKCRRTDFGQQEFFSFLYYKKQYGRDKRSSHITC